MTDVVDRFINYAKIDTQSSESSNETPSTPGQWKLARMLESELNAMNLKNITLDSCCYLYALLPANTNKKTPKIGFIAHLDTSPEEKGKDVKPVITFNENGQQIIKSDGQTLLGADDKAGIAEIMTAIEYYVEHPEIEHGDVYIAFTPDEEIGRGTDYFNREKFRADFAYTVDGGAEGEIEIENFNAAKAVIDISGKVCHPGYAKNIMRNATLIATKVIEIISSESIPEISEGRQGFYHVTKLSGNVDHATIECLIREFDYSEFTQKKDFLKHIVSSINDQFGESVAKLNIIDQYRNMFSIISEHPYIVSRARDAMIKAGVTPKLTPIRGGTDGVKLSFCGLPCPNLYAGGINFHSKEEYIPVSSLKSAVETIKNIIVNI